MHYINRSTEAMTMTAHISELIQCGLSSTMTAAKKYQKDKGTLVLDLKGSHGNTVERWDRAGPELVGGQISPSFVYSLDHMSTKMSKC